LLFNFRIFNYPKIPFLIPFFHYVSFLILLHDATLSRAENFYSISIPTHWCNIGWYFFVCVDIEVRTNVNYGGTSVWDICWSIHLVISCILASLSSPLPSQLYESRWRGLTRQMS
jgi:hypothetical protein